MRPKTSVGRSTRSRQRAPSGILARSESARADSDLAQTSGVQGGGFEPPKAEPAGLQPAPFGHSGIPARARHCSLGFHGVVRAVAYDSALGYVLAVVLATSFLPGGGGLAGAAGERPEAPLAALVATGATATTAVLVDARWSVELPFLYPGDTDPAVAPDGSGSPSSRSGTETRRCTSPTRARAT